MLEDEALGFCYALQCYSSQNENRYPENRYPSPMAILIAHQMLIQPVVVVWYIFRWLLTTCLKQTCTMLQFDNCHCGFLV